MPRGSNKKVLKKRTVKKVQKKKVVKKPTKKVAPKKRTYKKSAPKKAAVRKAKIQPARLCASKDIEYIYKNRKDQWYIIEMYEDCSFEENYELLESHILTTLGQDTEYFIPIFSKKIREKIASVVLFEGYFFVMCTDETRENIYSLKSDMVKGPITVKKNFKYVANKDINKFKKELQKKIKNMIPRKGQTVIPKVGVFKNLEGIVKSIDKNKLIAMVVFERSSRVVEAPINVINLEAA